jgi:anti-anti-sigma factor
MPVRTRLEQGVTILQASGSITAGAGARELRNAGQAALAAAAEAIVIDCGGITLMDSSGLGELVALKRAMDRSGGNLRLAGLPRSVAEVLTAAGFMSSFSTYPDVDAAVRSF